MRHSTAIAGSNIVVQVIHVTWDKSGRGGVAAERRNQIPLALPLPDQLRPDIGCHLLVHESHWGHTNGFADEIRRVTRALHSDAGFRYRCVTVRAMDAVAELVWTCNAWGGIPPREMQDSNGNTVPLTHRCVVRENEWARARWNGRFTCIDTGTWWYEGVTVNVGVWPDAETPINFFTRSEPTEDYCELAYLR